MGVEYRQFLLPADRSLEAAPERLEALINGLTEGGWLPLGGAQQKLDEDYRSRRATPDPLTVALRTSEAEDDLLLRWSIEGVGDHREPFVRGRRWEADHYFAIEIHACRDYVDGASESVDPVSPACECGADISTEAQGEVFSGRLLAQCRECRRPFDPSLQTVEARNGFTGEPWRLVGGAVYRFAVVIECGKGFFWWMNKPDDLIALDPDFERVIAAAFDGRPVSVPDFY